MWRHSNDFSSIISEAWNVDVVGSKNCIVVQKLKNLNRVLRELNKKGFNDVQIVDLLAFQAMKEAQDVMHQHPGYTKYADQS